MDCFNSEWGSVQAEVPVVSSYRRPWLASQLGNRVQAADHGRVPSDPAFAPAALALSLSQRKGMCWGLCSDRLLYRNRKSPAHGRRGSLWHLIYSLPGWIAAKSRTGCSPSRLSPGSSPLRDSRWLNVYVSVECLCIFVHLFISFIIVVLLIFWICNSS